MEWRTIINEQNVPLTNEIKVSIGGTTLYPIVLVIKYKSAL